MSTKALIIVNNDDVAIYLRREHDGFCAATGGDLVHTIFKCGTTPKASTIATALLALKSSNGDPLFSLCDGVPDDISHAYNVDLSEGKFRMAWATNPHEDGRSPDEWMEENVEYESLRRFTEAVNMEITSMNRILYEKGITAMFPPITVFEPASPAKPRATSGRAEDVPNTAIEQTAVDLIRARLAAAKSTKPAVTEGRGTGKTASVKEAMESVAKARVAAEAKGKAKPAAPAKSTKSKR